MPRLAAFLRAVNVGGTGKLAMGELRAICAEAGFADARTLLQSGNVVFDTGLDAEAARAALEARLAAHLERPVRVLIRDAAALHSVLAENPFPGAEPARLSVLFLDHAPPLDIADSARGRANEEIAAGAREVYIHYRSGMGRSRLRLPGTENGTARNLNTLRKVERILSGPGEP